MKHDGHQKPANGVNLATPVLEHPARGPSSGGRAPRRRARTNESLRLQERLDEMTANARAVTTLVAALEHATTAQEAVRLALDTVREAFGLFYGSYWVVDPQDGARLAATSRAVRSTTSGVASPSLADSTRGRAWWAKPGRPATWRRLPTSAS